MRATSLGYIDACQGAFPARVRAVIDDPEIEIKITGEPSEPSPVSNLWSEGARPIADAVRQTLPDGLAAPALSISTSDSRHYFATADNSYFFLPTRVDGAGLARIHGVDERISVRAHSEEIRFYAQLMVNVSMAARQD